MPEAIVFLLRAVVLVLLWGFVVAAIVAVRHDVFGVRPRRVTAPPAPAARKPPAAKPVKPRRKRNAPPQSVVVVEGGGAGTTVALTGLPVTIGRAADSTIVLADDYASNHHARLVPADGQWMIEDTGSTNGTFVGDTRVNGRLPVTAGTRIRIGRSVLELRP
ncbi:MAG TPA: FHA domain-containing protein [Mycobacteriales bacterium]|nr:FHA domain-containing protein [Mycobacteriales bacterium]